MASKADADHTPDAAIQKMAAQPPLDDDARWLLIEAAHDRGVERTGDNDLAVIDLEKLLAEGSLRCMRRSTVSGERIQVAAIAWTELIRLDCGKEVRVIYRKPLHQSSGGFYVVNTVRGWVFYVWQPDLDRIWPPAGSAPVDHAGARATKQPLPIDRALAVLPDIFPPDGKPPLELTLNVITKAVADKCKERGWTPPGRDTVARALGRRE